MRGRDLNRSIKIFIDNTDAMQKSDALKAKIAELRTEMTRLEAQGKKESRQYISTEKALRKHELTQSKYLNTVKETQRVLKNLSGATYNELNAARRVVHRELMKEKRGTEEYTQKLRIYQQVQKELAVARKEMRGDLGKEASLFSKMTGSFNKYLGIVSAFAASITGLSLAFRKLSQDAAKMTDVYDGVSKTTGLTRQQVEKLNEEFKKMDTRVPREELNKFAEDAGKLGKQTEEDILGFVNAAVRIRVGIGKDLGDDALTDIAKMTDIFAHSTKEMEKMNLEERMIATGSAIRYLAKQSTAAEPPMVAFASRMTGIASQANISMQNILGYGSALDQLKQPTEMAATALQKMIMKMFTDTSTYANIAGMSLQRFNHLLTTDTNRAIKTVLRSLNDQGGFQQLAPMFEDMGLAGARAVGVLSALASNIDMIDQAQYDANKSFRQAVTLEEEYEIMNKNAQASLEKRRQAFKDAAEELGNRLNPALLKSTNILTYIIKLTPAVLDFFTKYGKLIGYLVTVYATYTAAKKLNVWWSKLEIKTLIALYLEHLKYIKAQAAMDLQWIRNSKSVMQFIRSLRALFVTLGLNPIGAFVAIIGAAAIAIYKLTRRTEELTTKASIMADANEAAAKATARERAELDLLLGVARNEKISKEERLKAIEKLNEISPEYLGNLDLENINTREATDAVKDYTKALMDNAKQKAIADAVSDLYAKRVKLEAKLLREQQFLEERRAAGIGRSDIDRIHENISRRLEKDIEKLNEEISLYDELHQSLAQNKEIEIDKLFLMEESYDLEVQRLEDMKQRHADAYKEMTGEVEGFYVKRADLTHDWSQGNKLTQEHEMQLLKEQIEHQEALVARREAEIEKEKESREKSTSFQKKSTKASVRASQDAYRQKLAALDHYMAQEREKYMRQYLSGQISHAQYLHHLEQLERESLERQLDIYEYDVVRKQDITNRILDMKLKMLRMLEESERKHTEKIIEMQEKAEQARRDSNYETLKDIAKQNAEDWEKRKRAQYEAIADMAEMAFEFSNELGSMLGAAAMGNEDLVKSSLKNILNLALDALKVQVQIAIAGATAQSLAQPDSVATFGVAGFARAAILVGMIEAAFAAVKGVVNSYGGGTSGISSGSGSTTTHSRVIDQRRDGKYDVIGAQDGKHYSVPYLGPARTGVVSNPVLVGEYGDELIISAPDFTRLQRHVNYPLILSAIQESRVPQRAEGNYSALPPPGSQTKSATVQAEQMMHEMLLLLKHLNSHGVKASVVLSDIERAQSRMDNIRRNASR